MTSASLVVGDKKVKRDQVEMWAFQDFMEPKEGKAKKEGEDSQVRFNI